MFIKNVLVSSGLQIAYIFCPFLLFGLALYLLAKLTKNTFIKTIGLKADIFFTGWIGTPVHELGHAFFCLVFFHKIEEIQLFKPDTKNGTLGYVNHTYNKRNIFHLLGNFFIGIGPLLSGSFVMLLLLFFLFPDTGIYSLLSGDVTRLSPGLPGIEIWFQSVARFAFDFFVAVFNFEHLKSWQFWVFLYTSMAVASHMELSISDLKGTFSGFLMIIVIILIVNSISIAAGADVTKYAQWLSVKTGFITKALICSSVMSFVCFLLVFFVLSIINLIRKKEFISPF